MGAGEKDLLCIIYKHLGEVAGFSTITQAESQNCPIHVGTKIG